jgi:hypothetical protein
MSFKKPDFTPVDIVYLGLIAFICVLIMVFG